MIAGIRLWSAFVPLLCCKEGWGILTNKKTNGVGLTVPLGYEWARSLLHQIVVKEVVEGMIGTIFHGDNGPIEESVFLWKRRRRGLINFCRHIGDIYRNNNFSWVCRLGNQFTAYSVSLFLVRFRSTQFAFNLGKERAVMKKHNHICKWAQLYTYTW